MSRWIWSPRVVKWHEHLAFALAFVAWIEGPLFYSDLVRGIAIGLSASALLTMLAGRHAFYSILSAYLVWASVRMAPHSPAGWVVAFDHLFAVMILAAPFVHAWSRERPQPGIAQGEPSQAK